MINKIIEKLENKKIAIVGFGKEGKSTYSFIRRYLKNQRLTILDQKEIKIDDENVNIIWGDGYLDNLEDYDIIIKSPGVSFININISNIEGRITSQLELLLEVDSKNVIGITGTKGKSTTTTMTYEVLKDQLKDVFLLGNIGIPIFDEIEKFTPTSKLVIEMSSHQLEFVRHSPHVAALLNLYQDHLDHDGNIGHYYQNKMNIFKYQSEEDFSLYSTDDSNIINEIKNIIIPSIKYTVRFDNKESCKHSIRKDGNNILIDDEIVYKDSNRKLLGDHNLKNIMFVLGIAKIYNLDLERASRVINKFQGLKYRMEFIGTYHGIKFYNDTIATIPKATISAIETIGDVDTLIFGGLDRKISYEELIDYLKDSNINNLICMPTTGTNIGKRLEEMVKKNFYYTDSLEEAYKISKKVTKKGKSCLLSPSAASYEYFKNFEEKGRMFEELIKKDKSE